MGAQVLNSTCIFVLLMLCACATPTLAQSQVAGTTGSPSVAAGTTEKIQPIDLEVSITGPDGTPFKGTAEVTVASLDGEIYRIETVTGGHANLGGLPEAEYGVVHVEAGGYEEISRKMEGPAGGTTRMKVIVELQPLGGEEKDKELDRDATVLSLTPSVQQQIGKAFEALGHKDTDSARSHLETAYRLAPNSAEVNYLLGVYSIQKHEAEKAKSYWAKTLELYPRHYRALISMGRALAEEDKFGEAMPYLERAVKVEPNSWRAHAIYADAYLRQGLPDEAVKHAELAIHLDPVHAAVMQRHLAAALARHGEKERAIGVLQTYVQGHHSDNDAKRQLKELESAEAPVAAGAAGAAKQDLVVPWTLDEVTALPLPATWLPADIDRRIPPVKAGASCSIDEVVKMAGQRIEEFVKNVDRFTATEFLTHESISKWGVGSPPEKRKFEYLVSVEEVVPGALIVDEYRTDRKNPRVEFPDGIETRGLPALVLVFHPYNVGTFEMTCEGLTQVEGKPAWQVHFVQRKDKPNRIRQYRVGLNGPAYFIALKGRAWIAADTYQIKRLETDLVAPIPEIQLFADHTSIEYGVVHFKNRDVEMWLPQTAEVYYDWRGKRTYRRHSFSSYLLFAVDDKQKISTPKTETEGTGGAEAASGKPPNS